MTEVKGVQRWFSEWLFDDLRNRRYWELKEHAENRKCENGSLSHEYKQEIEALFPKPKDLLTAFIIIIKNVKSWIDSTKEKPRKWRIEPLGSKGYVVAAEYWIVIILYLSIRDRRYCRKLYALRDRGKVAPPIPPRSHWSKGTCWYCAYWKRHKIIAYKNNIFVIILFDIRRFYRTKESWIVFITITKKLTF